MVKDPEMDDPKSKDWEKHKHVTDSDDPDYKGAWGHPEVDNLEYDKADAKYEENSRQVKSRTIFKDAMVSIDGLQEKMYELEDSTQSVDIAANLYWGVVMMKSLPSLKLRTLLYSELFSLSSTASTISARSRGHLQSSR